MSRPTTRRTAAQLRTDTDLDPLVPDFPETEASEDGADGHTDERDGADPATDVPNVSARELMELLGRVLAGRTPAAPTPPVTSRPVKVNPPEEFDGRSARKLKSFLVSCNNAFRGDPDAFAHDDKRVTFALSYLRGSAQRHFDHQLEDEEEPHFVAPPWLNHWPSFVEELREMFADPNSEATAEADLDNLRMRANQKFSDFLVEFNVLASQVNWGDRALRHRLKQALPDRIKDNLVLVQEPSGLLEWKHLVLSMDRRYWERQEDIRREGRLKPNPTRNSSTPTASTAAAQPKNTSTGSTPAPKTGGGNATTTPRHLTPNGSLSSEERERRIANGLCLYCGGEGHKALECSKAKASKVRQGRAAETVSAAPPTPSPPKETVTSTSSPTVDNNVRSEN
jgi:Retrotransposon gag protein